MAGFREQDFALRMRKIIRREIKAAIDELRPSPQYGRIVSGEVTLSSSKALVLLNGGTEAISCHFVPGNTPHPGRADVVEVQRINRTYWITRIISGSPVDANRIALNSHLETRRSIAVTPPSISPAVTVIARFHAENLGDGELAVARLQVNQYQNFGSWSVRTYQHLFEAQSLGTLWVAVSAVDSAKADDAESFILRVRRGSSSNSFELGISRTAGNAITPGPYYFDITVGGVSWTWDMSSPTTL